MNNQDVLVSVVMPVYAVEEYLPRAIESIQNQSHINFELLIIIDGSPDKSEDIARSYAKLDNRIKVITKVNGGVSSARNVGIDAAIGNYICFVDPDDYVENEYIEYMLKIAVDNKADIALTRKIFGTYYNNKQIHNDKIRILNGEEATVEILYYQIPIGCICKLYKLDLINMHNIRFLEYLNIGEGFNFNTTAFQKSKIVATGERKIYYYFRKNITSAMTKFDINKCINGLHAIDTIRNNLLIKSKKLYRAVDYAEYHTNLDFYIWMKNANKVSYYRDYYMQWRRVARSKAYNFIYHRLSTADCIRAVIVMLSPSLLDIVFKYKKKYLS